MLTCTARLFLRMEDNGELGYATFQNLAQGVNFSVLTSSKRLFRHFRLEEFRCSDFVYRSAAAIHLGSPFPWLFAYEDFFQLGYNCRLDLEHSLDSGFHFLAGDGVEIQSGLLCFGQEFWVLHYPLDLLRPAD